MVARRKIVLIIVSLVAISSGAPAQQSAIAKDGREVILYPDGRWTYRGPASSSVQTKPLAAKKTLEAKAASTDYPLMIRSGFKKHLPKRAMNFILSIRTEISMLSLSQNELPMEALRNIVIQNVKDCGFEI